MIFENGLPKLSDFQREEETLKWDKTPLKIRLKNDCEIGTDSLKLYFSITKDECLNIKCLDIYAKDLTEFNIENIF